jgi:prepilin-type N-terminal cleavage/methylation domain-containing protein
MYARLREARKNESGFTLIELLIVIVILGVLAGIVVFAVSAFNNDGVTAACKSDVKNVEIASEAYFAKNSVRATAIGLKGSVVTTELVGAGYLKEPPSTAKYTVIYDATTGNASSTGCP